MPNESTKPSEYEIRRVVNAAREIWMRRLVDHSRANSLLFFRDLKVGTLDLTNATEAVERLLNGEAVGVDLLALAAREPSLQDPVLRIREHDEARTRIKSALVALRRKALSNLEEKGIGTLHLAFALTTWPAPDGGRAYNAPALLVPARIESRGRSSDELRLFVSGDAQVNPVLIHVLEENYGLRLDANTILSGCGSIDDAGEWRVKPQSVVRSVAESITAVAGFEVSPRVILANFQFAKMAMVEDIKKNIGPMAASPIVAAIAGHTESRRSLSEPGIDLSLSALDERPATDDFLVLDADSSQQRAIVLASRGENGVVQGPPGTGKSQTIANLIAQSVADGKRVLFVAEKRAALDAVIKRLAHPDVQLEHLILDLHGASVSRKEVMAKLADTLDQIRHATPPEGVEAVNRGFEARRRQLNAHARLVNGRREPTGLSVSEMIGRLLLLPPEARSWIRIRGERLAQLTPDRADAVRQWLLEGTAYPTLLLGTDTSAWNNADIRSGAEAQKALDLATGAAAQQWPAFAAALARVVRQLGIRAPETLDETSNLLRVLESVVGLREHYSSAIFANRPQDLAAALAPATNGAPARAWAYLTRPNYRAARRSLRKLRNVSCTAATLGEEATLAAHTLDNWRALQPASDLPTDIEGVKELCSAFVAVDQATMALGAITEGGAFRSMELGSAERRLHALAEDSRTPYRLPSVLASRARFAESGLSFLLDDLRNAAVPVEHWRVRFEHIWLHSALDQALASDPSLASFKGRVHEQLIEEFVRLDSERVRLAGQRVRRLHAERAIAAQNEHFEQANLVRTEANKKKRHIALRELLARAPDVLTRLAPCWVASPLSVSQLLEGSNSHFDLVVFDEASQVLQEEAIPALYRATQVVVAGDQHQLPPTTFFATAVEEPDEVVHDAYDADAVMNATAAIGGFESLLGTMQAFLPNWMLEWHYRSRDERLIAFSNAHIYAGRLITFPSANGSTVIRHIHVPHDPALGGQEESASREIEEVVRQVLSHATERRHESLGVITLGIKHANRLQAALDRALELRPELVDFFSLDREERFFIKNLETVQGDERDAIIVSVGYGKTASGDLPHRFGPLTQDAGYRRLNVAITRARQRMCVISSFAPHEIDLDRSGSRGVRLLKAYLEYAASGGTRLSDVEEAGQLPLNAFEADIRDALDGRGIHTRAQYGSSRYRIDLVAMHPTKSGRPVLAIECDGAAYHSSATARDRDRLRQSHLERLGWRFHRIWSTDWFHSREEEIIRAVIAYQDAVRRADEADGDMPAEAHSDMSHVLEAHLTVATPAAVQRGPRPVLQRRDDINEYDDQELRQLAQWIVSDGLLRTDEEFVRELFDALPFQRMGTKIRTRLERIARIAMSGGDAGRRSS